MILPFGSIPGFSLQAEIREVASHYGVEARALRGGDGRSSDVMALARNALFWKLHKQRGMSTRRVAKLLRCSHAQVASGATAHAALIAEFRLTSGLKG